MKYNAAFDREYSVKIMTIFESSEESLTIQGITAALGTRISAQKVVRLIDEVNKFMPILRQKGRDGLMHYKAKPVHEAQGYDVSFYTGPKNLAELPEENFFAPDEKGWVAPRYRVFYNEKGEERI